MRSGISKIVVLGTALSALMISAISGPALGQNDSPDATFENGFEEHMLSTAHWMLEQPDPVRQAAGLLMQQKIASEPSSTTGNSEALQTRIADLLDQSKDPRTLALLAAICHQVGIQSSCIDLGLAEAIVKHDQGNAISLAYLYPNDSDKFEEILLSAQTVDDYFFLIAEVWDLALQDYWEARMNPELRKTTSIQAMSIVMAIATPGYGRLVAGCRSGNDESALALGCARLSELATRSSNSLMLRMTGLSIARERALADNNEVVAGQMEFERQHLQNRVSCIHQAIPESHWQEGNETGSNYIRSAARYGEVAAAEALAEHYNVECPASVS